MAYFIFSSFQGPAFGKICPAAPEISGFRPLSKRPNTQPFPFPKVSPLLSHISRLCSICPFPPFPHQTKKWRHLFLDSEIERFASVCHLWLGRKISCCTPCSHGQQVQRRLPFDVRRSTWQAVISTSPGMSWLDSWERIHQSLIDWCILRSKSINLLMSDHFGENFLSQLAVIQQVNFRIFGPLEESWVPGSSRPSLLRVIIWNQIYLNIQVPVRCQVYQKFEASFLDSWYGTTVQALHTRFIDLKRFGRSNTANMFGTC